MNAPLVMRPQVRLAIAAELKKALVELEPAAYSAFIAAKRYAESALSEYLVDGAIQEELWIALGDVVLVICFDRSSERYYIAAFFCGDFDPPPGVHFRAPDTNAGKLVYLMLARLGIESPDELAGDLDGASFEDCIVNPAFLVLWNFEFNDWSAARDLRLADPQGTFPILEQKLERRPRQRSHFFGILDATRLQAFCEVSSAPHQSAELCFTYRMIDYLSSYERQMSRTHDITLSGDSCLQAGERRILGLTMGCAHAPVWC